VDEVLRKKTPTQSANRFSLVASRTKKRKAFRKKTQEKQIFTCGEGDRQRNFATFKPRVPSPPQSFMPHKQQKHDPGRGEGTAKVLRKSTNGFESGEGDKPGSNTAKKILKNSNKHLISNKIRANSWRKVVRSSNPLALK